MFRFKIYEIIKLKFLPFYQKDKFTKVHSMKKLIINEKNLPKIGKSSDSSIRIRINKIQNGQDLVSVPKSIPATIQDIDTCLQTLQKFINGTLSLDEEFAFLIAQLLKQYKHVLNPNMELMTQSLKFTKLKFRNGVETEEKENSPILAKLQRNGKEIPASDRISRLTEKSQVNPSNKSQKNRKLVSVHKKNSEKLEAINDHSEKDEALVRVESSKEESQSLAQSRQSKIDQDKTGQHLAQSFDESIVFHEKIGVVHEGLGVVQEPRIKHLQEQVTMLTKSLRQKAEEIGELQERIEQLGANVQNLIKKNSQKSQEYNKLQEENEQLIEKIKKLSVKTENSQQHEQLKNKSQQMESQMQAMRKKKEEMQKRLKALEREKEDKKEQELGRYETAQHFYELSRRDLRQQNENLMALLEERQCQLANLYQVIGSNSNAPFMPVVSKLSPSGFIAV